MPLLRSRYPPGPLLKHTNELGVSELPPEAVHHISGARIVLAEYEILRHDFPELSSESLLRENPQLLDLEIPARHEAERAIIDTWLIANAAFISTSQADQSVVNTPIATDGDGVAYRPPKYGRALVAPIQRSDVPGAPWRWSMSQGLLDLKGTGVEPGKVPSSSTPQSNGLETLGYALSDYLMKRALDEVFARELPEVWTVPVYAVLDLGFDVLSGDFGTGPAGMHVRRAHRRRIPREPTEITGEESDLRIRHEIETCVRRYGLTAASHGHRLSIVQREGRLQVKFGSTVINSLSPTEIGLYLTLKADHDEVLIDNPDIQLTRERTLSPLRAQLVDFGCWSVQKSFKRPLCSGFGPFLASVLRPEHPDFVLPDPALSLPTEVWGFPALRGRCFALAKQFRHGEISRQELRRVLDEPIESLLESWSARSTANCRS
jgi:hypothetical protein